MIFPLQFKWLFIFENYPVLLLSFSSLWPLIATWHRFYSKKTVFLCWTFCSFFRVPKTSAHIERQKFAYLVSKFAFLALSFPLIFRLSFCRFFFFSTFHTPILNVHLFCPIWVCRLFLFHPSFLPCRILCVHLTDYVSPTIFTLTFHALQPFAIPPSLSPPSKIF